MRFFVVVITMLMLSMTSAQADKHGRMLIIGQKIFKKKLRRYCRFSGVRFARYHTQDEWEEIWDEGRFAQETKKICPRLDITRIKKSWWRPVYEFTHEYARGSGHVPHC